MRRAERGGWLKDQVERKVRRFAAKMFHEEAAGIEPAPGGAKPLAESRPYLVTARNA
jgi:hypothetical protein